jgi:hypothetical protein
MGGFLLKIVSSLNYFNSCFCHKITWVCIGIRKGSGIEESLGPDAKNWFKQVYNSIAMHHIRPKIVSFSLC